MAIKKLIEVALPLDKINAESAREKSIRHGHPSTLHLWWARRPLCTARAMIWASLVDDPSSHPELFPTDEDQKRERQRLFGILEQLVKWENLNNQEIIQKAKAEIQKYANGNLPEFLDPFAGGGALPLEAQRLGLKAHAHDLNPVAVMINKAMIEIPARFMAMAPVNAESNTTLAGDNYWNGASGLAADVEYYGQWMKEEAFARVGHLYPKITIPQRFGGGKSDAVAWLWARTVKCPNPACGCRVPLAKTFNLSNKNKKGIQCSVVGEHVEYHVAEGAAKQFPGTIGRKGGTCIACKSPISYSYIREQSKKGEVGVDLTAIVVERPRGRLFLDADDEQRVSANVEKPDIVLGQLAYYPGYINPVAYGLENIEDLFSGRQISAINVFSELVRDAQSKVEQDAIIRGLENDHIHLRDGGKGATAYAEAVAVYLAFAVDRLADKTSTLCQWDSSRDGVSHTFSMTGMPMLWDYAEANPFSNSSGCFSNMITWVVECIKNSPTADQQGIAQQMDAQSDAGFENIMISTDPPYYNNVPYADFADFFYVWMRRSIKHIYPSLFATMLTPKVEELVADPYRHGSKEDAASHFEGGMYETCKNLYKYSHDDIPVTIYYAYKQNETTTTDEGGEETTFTGWETMLSAVIRAGFSIKGTWPVRTELTNRVRANESNALASSIVLVCRKRKADAPACTRRNFINELKRELKAALQKLQESNIAPVDLAQSAIGPGMGVFSKYSKVLEADGTPMTVRSALQIINQELDLYFNEQDGALDSESRFCVDLYSQVAFNEMRFGDANTLATAKNTSVAIMASHGTLFAQKGVVHLVERPDLPVNIDSNESCVWLLTQQLTYKMEKEGIEGCAKAICTMFGSNGERAKDLAYRLYTIAERKHWAQEAYAYNALVVAWPEIQSRAAELKAIQPEQMTLFDALNN